MSDITIHKMVSSFTGSYMECSSLFCFAFDSGTLNRYKETVSVLIP